MPPFAFRSASTMHSFMKLCFARRSLVFFSKGSFPFQRISFMAPLFSTTTSAVFSAVVMARNEIPYSEVSLYCVKTPSIVYVTAAASPFFLFAVVRLAFLAFASVIWVGLVVNYCTGFEEEGTSSRPTFLFCCMLFPFARRIWDVRFVCSWRVIFIVARHRFS